MFLAFCHSALGLCELMGRLGIGEDECTMDDHDHDSHEDDHDSHEDHDDDDDHDDHDDHDHRKRREAGHLIQKRQADMAAIEVSVHVSSQS